MPTQRDIENDYASEGRALFWVAVTAISIAFWALLILWLAAPAHAARRTPRLPTPLPTRTVPPEWSDTYVCQHAPYLRNNPTLLAIYSDVVACTGLGDPPGLLSTLRVIRISTRACPQYGGAMCCTDRACQYWEVPGPPTCTYWRFGGAYGETAGPWRIAGESIWTCDTSPVVIVPQSCTDLSGQPADDALRYELLHVILWAWGLPYDDAALAVWPLTGVCQ